MDTKIEDHSHHHHHHDSCGGALYGLGVIGALFYFFQHITTFTAGVVAIAKAFFWPAFIVFRVLEMLKV
jgi:hypothetical protein